MTEICYCTREDVQEALELSDSLTLNRRIDRAIRSASRDLERLCHRYFYPTTGTRSFDMPSSTRLWLHENELAAAPTSILSGGTVMGTSSYFLNPLDGPPYRWIEQNLSGPVAWQSGDTVQRSIAITGDYGYPVNPTDATTAVGSATPGATSITIADSAAVGVGQLMLIEAERIAVTEKTLTTTGATLSAPGLPAGRADVGLTVSSGALLHLNERIMIDAEWMRIESIAGNTVVVSRASNGTVLAAHSAGAVIYAPRILTVARGLLGTTAAAHGNGVAVTNLLAPSLVVDGAIALSINTVGQQTGAYNSTTGSGGRVGTALGANKTPAGGAGIDGLMEQIYTAYGRKTRTRVVGT